MQDGLCRTLYKGYWRKKPVTVYAEETPAEVLIPTLEGEMTASPGDMIITGVNGEKYPCKPDIFFKTYEFVPDTKLFDFGTALNSLKSGKKVARPGWNGKGMFVYYVPANDYPAWTEAAKSIGEMIHYNPYFAIKNVNGTVSTWVPSVNDALAEDWMIVE